MNKNIRQGIGDFIRNLLEMMHKRRLVLIALSCVVVFVTTYLLILPAFTLEKDEAAKQGGIDVPAVEEVTETGLEDSTKDDVLERSEQSGDSALMAEKKKDNTSEAEETDSRGEKSEKANKSERTTADGLTYEGEDFTISIEDKKSVLPNETSIKVEEIDKTSKESSEQYKKLYEEALKAVQEEKGGENIADLGFARFYDISLAGDDGTIEPESAVDVRISYESKLRRELKAENTDNVRIIHFAEDKKTGEVTPEVLKEKDVEVNTDSKDRLTDTTFKAEGFSVYAVVYTKELRTSVISDSGDTYEVTVSYDDEAEIPDGAELKANEVKAGSENYKEYLSDAADALESNSESITFARFFDIEIIKDGKKIEPKTPVKVSIKYSEAPDVADDSKLSVIHFASDGTEVIDDVDLKNDGKEFVYEQSSFSVTGTIISEPPQGRENKYMVLVNYPNGSDSYYIVNNDGSLTKVDYDPAHGTVDVEDPMLWTIDGNNPNRHIYFNAEATGFNYQDTAADYFRRYLDPNSASGITEEDEHNITLGRYWGDNVKTGYVVTNRDNMLNQTAVNNYKDNGVEKIYHGEWNDNNALGVELDAEGNPVRVSGKNNWGDAVNVVFAEPRSVPAVGTSHHTVDHIDISISGKSEVTVPLAFGTYYYKDSNGNWKEYTVTESTSVDLEKDDVSITPEDMKKADIRAYNTRGEELNNAFVIDGYSSNAANGTSTVQVRIGGRFKVADTYDGGGNEWCDKQRRLSNKITYVVSAIKNLDFDIADEEHGQLYEKLADGSYKKLSINIDVNMSASFDYWDEANECPGINSRVISGSHEQWVNGGIPDHGLSGMDFVLGGDAEDANSKIVALEITKMVMDEHGNLIKPSKKIVNTFDVNKNPTTDNNYKNDSVKDLNVGEYERPADYTGYSPLHTKDVVVGNDGIGLVYDYAVTDGMYYISERHDQESLPETIVDTDGKTWTYKNTYIETEYVRRGDKYDDKTAYPKPMHVSDTYSDKENDSYNSIPEVLGTFTTLKGEKKKEGFLEFFVYNVYSDGTELSVEKEWSDGAQKHIGHQVEYTLYRTPYTENAEYPPEEVEKPDPQDTDAVAHGYTGVLSSDNNWKEDITNLPESGRYTPTGSSSSVYVSYRYYIDEGEYPGYSSELEGGLNEEDGTYSFKIKNKPYGSFDTLTELNISKEWQDAQGREETSGHENDTITFNVIQKAFIAKYKSSNGQTYNVYPVKINLYDADGKLSDQSKTVYVPNGGILHVTPESLSKGQVVGEGFQYGNDKNQKSGYKYQRTVGTAREVSLKLKRAGDTWGTKQGNTVWTITLGSNSTERPYIDESELLDKLVLTGSPVDSSIFNYSMALNEAKDDTVVTPLQGAQGQGAGNGVWNGKVSNLPLFKKQGNTYYIYTYEVSEVKIGTESVETTTETGFNGQTSQYFVKWAGNGDSWTITNRKKPTIDIKIKKEDEIGNDLEGATFQLKVNTSGNEWKPVSEAEGYTGIGELSDKMIGGKNYKSTFTTTGDIQTITGFPDGTYKLIELEAPEGYIIDIPEIDFKIENGTMSMITQNELIKFTPSSGSELALLEIKNKLGAELPHTGGIGTYVIYITGMALVLGSGAMLIRRRRPSRRG